MTVGEEEHREQREGKRRVGHESRFLRSERGGRKRGESIGQHERLFLH